MADAPNARSKGGAAKARAGRSSSLGAFIRAQRELANMSLRQASTLAEISNAYLSQIERDLHEPSIRVLKNVAEALGIPPETMLAYAGMRSAASDAAESQGDEPPAPPSTEDAILADPHITDDEKQVLLSVYRSYRNPR